MDRIKAASRPDRFPEKAQTQCPRCDATRIEVLPANNPGSLLEWFRCAACGHMWSQQRDRG